METALVVPPVKMKMDHFSIYILVKIIISMGGAPQNCIPQFFFIHTQITGVEYFGLTGI
jgi:hypothetical protein